MDKGQLSLDIKLKEGFTETENTIIALLFAYGEPVEFKELLEAIGTDKKTGSEIMDTLIKKMEYKDEALLIKKDGNLYELSTNPKYFDSLIKLVKTVSNPPLSDTLMETLAIIASKGEATKPDIENIRGVKSDFAVNKLIEYGLVEEKGRLNVPGRPIILGVTTKFYRRFNVSGIEDMPIVEQNENEYIRDEVVRETGELLIDND